MMEVGQLVRTKNKGICKIEGFASTLTDDYIENEKGSLILKAEITKASHNIIDLIQENDFVNGHRVIEVDRESLDIYIENSMYGCGCETINGNTDIKSIVTKGQFEAMQYKIMN